MHSVPNIVITKLMWLRWVELLSCMKKNKLAYRVFVGNLEAKNHLEDLSIMLKHLEEAVWEGVDWIHVAQDRDQ